MQSFVKQTNKTEIPMTYSFIIMFNHESKPCLVYWKLEFVYFTACKKATDNKKASVRK